MMFIFHNNFVPWFIFLNKESQIVLYHKLKEDPKESDKRK